MVWCKVLQIILSKTHERLALVPLDSLVAWNWKQRETQQQLCPCQQGSMVLANKPFSYNHNAKSLSVKRLIDHTSGSCFSCSSWILAQCHLWLLDFADNNDHRIRSRSVCGTACYLHWRSQQKRRGSEVTSSTITVLLDPLSIHTGRRQPSQVLKTKPRLATYQSTYSLYW